MHIFITNCFFFLLLVQAFPANCCIEHERQALLQFKNDLHDPSNRLASWRGGRCCNWTRIRCSNQTGHVIVLDLHNPYNWGNTSLSGKINPALVFLSHLKHLDLSNNNFFGNRFPEFISSFKNLKYLDLSATSLSGILPPQLGNLSKLQYLNLASTDFSGLIPPQLGNLSKLQYLNLASKNFSGIIPPQLGNLSKLQYLNLASTDFSGLIPPQLGNLSKLQYLNLASTDFSGLIPPQLGNLSKLQYLNLASTDFTGLIPPQLGKLSKLQYLDLGYLSDTFATNARWLSHLTSLEYLDISGVYFRDSKEWWQALNMLSHLHTLLLAENGLTTIPMSINLDNFSSLEVLDIEWNCFNTTMPDWIGKLPNLKELDLWKCCFVGPIPYQLGNLTLLESLTLHDEFLEGPMPHLYNLKNLTLLMLSDVDIGEDIRDFMGKLANETLYKLMELDLVNTSLTGNLTGWLSKVPNLEQLTLSYNNLSGTIPTDIGNLTHLVILDLSYNSFTGEVAENHLNGMSMLIYLSLQFNFINFTVGRNWIPPFQLGYILLDRCKLGPYFPSWLQNQSHISAIELSDAGIVDTVPDWFWKNPFLYSLNLSKNALSGRLPPSLKHLTQLVILFLQNNQFEGTIPYLPSSLEYVDLSVNFFHGTIEQLTCGLDSLIVLNLKKNNLYGNLPRCWPNTLQVISLAHNKISGAIPDSISNSSLSILQLNNNSITGNLSSALESIQNLIILDIGENKLSGQIPEWIGKSLINLEVLRLPSNILSGEIPIQITHLANLQVLDLSSNQISGSIPHSMELMLAMTSTTENNNNSAYRNFLENNTEYYEVSVSVVTKGLVLDYSNTLSLLRSIDLSSNNFIGEIPQTITTLHGLQSLNLSNNNLHGSIPLQIGEMQSMESLDLRMNELSGTIPHSLGNLNFLTTLNLSYNNLSGEIPTGNQLQTLDDPYIYIGNAYLCGSPLSKSCNTSQTLDSYEAELNNYVDNPLIYLFAVIGFGIGFWLVCGTLLCNVKWRYCFFRVIDNGIDWLFVFCVVYVGRLLKDMRKNHG